MRRIIRTTTNFNDDSWLDHDLNGLINTLDCYYLCGNRTDYEVLKTGSMFRGREYMECRPSKRCTDLPEDARLYVEAVYVDHYIEPDYVKMLTNYVVEEHGVDAAVKLGLESKVDPSLL